MNKTLFALIMVAGLAACSEQPQELTASKQDSAAYTGTGKPYVQPDWKPGDKASWESQLKARNQHGQNDYTRMN
jgi:starvation-inducible outer membrane lipoprotein